MLWALPTPAPNACFPYHTSNMPQYKYFVAIEYQVQSLLGANEPASRPGRWFAQHSAWAGFRAAFMTRTNMGTGMSRGTGTRRSPCRASWSTSGRRPVRSVCAAQWPCAALPQGAGAARRQRGTAHFQGKGRHAKGRLQPRQRDDARDLSEFRGHADPDHPVGGQAQVEGGEPPAQRRRSRISVFSRATASALPHPARPACTAWRPWAGGCRWPAKATAPRSNRCARWRRAAAESG